MNCGVASRRGEITPVRKRYQPFGVQSSNGGDDLGIGRGVHLDALLASVEVEADQGIQFIDQIRSKWHVGVSGGFSVAKLQGQIL